MAKMVEAMTFTGWVEKIYPAGDYDQKFTVANYRNEDAKRQMNDAKEFTNTLCFSASTKNGASAALDDVREGDKVTVKFFLAGKSGKSKKTQLYYCVNNLNVAKSGGITVVERLKVDPSGQPQVVQADDEDADIPF